MRLVDVLEDGIGGDIVRFRTRSSLMLVAKTQQEFGWGSEVKLDERVVLELESGRGP